MSATPENAVLLRGGRVVDGSGAAPYGADVLIRGGRIIEIGPDLPERDVRVIDCSARLVIPGLIDMHSHADDAVFDEQIQLALLRQGVTTVVAGQDGVSYAPGDGAYASDYFGGLLGASRTYRGGGVSALLAAYDGRIPVNVAYLVPLGTVRHEVMGDGDRAAEESDRARMVELVRQGLRDGAVGVSTGLDYVPGVFASTAELTALAAVAAESDRVYVTHMRGGYEDNTAVGIDEVIEIAHSSGAHVHISHLHAEPDLLLSEMARMQDAGVAATFDAYPYRRGCTLLSMVALPPELVAVGLDEAAERLADPGYVDTLLDSWFPLVAARADLGAGWLDNLTYAHVPAPELAAVEGCTLREAGELLGLDPHRVVCAVLAATRLHAVVVARTPRLRSDDELARIFTSAFHTGGSDGIYTGGSPHPRGWGSFARYLGHFTRERGDYTWEQAVAHLATRGADVLRLTDRGRIVPGAVADIAILDPERVSDRATYRNPRDIAEGIDTVLVRGEVVLQDGELTGLLSGGGIRA